MLEFWILVNCVILVVIYVVFLLRVLRLRVRNKGKV